MEQVLENKEIKRASPFETRIHEIDFVRGMLIILVVMDHLFYCLGSYGRQWGVYPLEGFFYNFYWRSTIREIIQPMALMAFCFVSGVSSSFSKNNWKRTIQILIVWAVLLIATHIIMFLGFGVVTFNIIAVLGFSMLFYCLIQKRSWKAIVAALLIIFLFSSYIVPALRQSLVSLCGGELITYRPGTYYDVPYFYFPLFFEPLQPVQADYVPLFPYIGFFFLGALFSYFFYKKDKKSIVRYKGNWERPICFLGRHTLIIYMVHFILLHGIFMLIGLFIKGV